MNWAESFVTLIAIANDDEAEDEDDEGAESLSSLSSWQQVKSRSELRHKNTWLVVTETAARTAPGQNLTQYASTDSGKLWQESGS